MFTLRRRPRLATAATALVAILLLAACDWTQFRYGPDHTGFNAFETTIGTANVSGLRLRWSQSVGTAGVQQPIAVANGVLYVVGNGKLYAFDANTGSARWTSRAIGVPLSGGSVANGVVYVSATDGLYALDAATGAKLWSSTAAGSPYVSPTVANGVVYVTTPQSGLDAFDATTGAKLWSFTAGHGLSYDSPTVANGVVYVTMQNELDALDATTGARLWSNVSSVGYGAAPAVANGVVYICTDKLQALNATTGVGLWSAQPCRSAPAVALGVVYVGGTELDAYDASTGAKLWSSNLDSSWAAPTVANGVVYIRANRLYAYDAVTGAQLWSAPTNGEPVQDSELVIANGVVYIGGNEPHAYGLPVTAPQLSISPAFASDFVFGQQPDLSSRVYTITNIGSTPTSAVADSLSGPDAAHFRLTSDGCAGTSLAGGASCTVTASFAPTRAGYRTAWLATSATDGGTARAQLTGTAQPFSVAPGSRTFADTYVGMTSTAVFQVTNLLNGPVGPFASAASPGSGFTVADDGCAGKTIAAGTSCTIAVAFAPTDAQQYFGTLAADAPGHHAVAYLDGTGVARLEVAPRPNDSGLFDFGSVPVGTTVSKTFTVTNISPIAAGPIADALGPFTVWGPPGPFDWFTTTADRCAGHTLAPHASCTLVMNFTPTSANSQAGTLTVTAPLAGGWIGVMTGSGS